MKRYFYGLNNNKDIKRQYKLLSKKYHPDNKETGDKSIFIEIQKQYEKAIKKHPIIERCVVKISEQQANDGCEIKYGDLVVVIPKNYKGGTKTVVVIGKKEDTIVYFNIIVKPDILYLNDLQNIIKKSKRSKNKNEIIDMCLNSLWSIWSKEKNQDAYDCLINVKSIIERRKK